VATSGGDIRLLASNIASIGATSLSAGYDVIVDTVDQTARRSDFDASSSLELGSLAVNTSTNTIYVAEVKSSRNGVDEAKSAVGIH